MDNYEHTFQTWNKVAHMYRDKFSGMDLYDDSYNLFCSLLEKPNASIFEIGCGPGNITHYLLTKRPDLKIEAIDMAPNMLAVAKGYCPTATFKIMDCRTIDQVNATFDGIMCGFCLPYLSKEDTLKFIKDSSALLVQNGILYFSAIEDEYSKSNYETSSNGEHTMFIYYHEADYLEKSLKDNHFEVVEVFRKNYKKNDGTNQVHTIFIARKK